MEIEEPDYPEPELITIWEAGYRSGRSQSTIYSSLVRGILRGERIEGATMIVTSSLVNLLKVKPGRPMGTVMPRVMPPELRLFERLKRMRRGNSVLAKELERVAKEKQARDQA